MGNTENFLGSSQVQELGPPENLSLSGLAILESRMPPRASKRTRLFVLGFMAPNTENRRYQNNGFYPESHYAQAFIDIFCGCSLICFRPNIVECTVDPVGDPETSTNAGESFN